MRKKLLVLVSVLGLVVGCFLIDHLQNSNFKLFNSVSASLAEKLQSKLEKKDELSFTALLCNDTRVPFDDVTNTFYVPVDMEDPQWEKLEFASGQPEYSVLLMEDITESDKRSSIADGKRFELLVYDNHHWSSYGLVFTGLPIIDLATNEGFYATEEITGTAAFYDIDFLKHGITQSAYNGHIRGNTSRMFPKKGYKINLVSQDQDGNEVKNKMSLFGMRKDDDWILYAMYNDDTKIRDQLSMKAWDILGGSGQSEKGYYGTRMTYVEVFADNSYCGLYGLLEPVDGKQLDLSEEDYLYKRKNSAGFNYENFFNEKDPYAIVNGFEIKYGEMNSNAWKPIAELPRLVYGSEEAYLYQIENTMDMDSAMRMWLFMQIITGHDHTAKNIFYVAKHEENGYKFRFVPWDMDLTWGNVAVGEINPHYTEYKKETVDDRVYWETVDRAIDLNAFDITDHARELYQQLRSTVLKNSDVEQYIYEIDAEIRNSGAYKRDEQRWPDGAHTDSCAELIRYAKERLDFLDKALFDFELFDN